MEINKLINKTICLSDWTFGNITPTDIETLAYCLYISENDEPRYNLHGFILYKNEGINYYNRASAIIRKEKLEKICSNQEIK